MTDELSDGITSRRRALAAMTIGAAPVLLGAAGSVQGQAPGTVQGAAQRPGMQDPRGVHPRPPFAAQRQD